MAAFEVNIGKLTQNAEALGELVEQFEREVNAMCGVEERLHSKWQGTAHSAFHKAFQQDIKQMKGFGRQVGSFARYAAMAASRYQRAENRAIHAIDGSLGIAGLIGINAVAWRELFNVPLIILPRILEIPGHVAVDPQELMAASSELASCAAKLNGILNSMLELVRSVTSFWTGEAAAAFLTKFLGLQDDMQKIVRMVQEHADDLSRIAASYLKAEQENVSDFSGLSADVIV